MEIKIAYIGGGSKQWARTFMSDLAVSENLSGEIALYDIDVEAAERNKKIGDIIEKSPDAKSRFKYTVARDLKTALIGANFVIMSILPGTFEDMRIDVHLPEKYGIYQSVGDSTGPGGMRRALRTVPVYIEFALYIREFCPNAWVINLTNPMSICIRALYDTFPAIKAFGCCHEVFHAQELLCIALRELRGINAERGDIYTDASGINHFTWITHARYRNIDLLSLLPEFTEKFYEEGYFEQKGFDRFAFKTNPFAYGNRIKLDLYRRYGALAAAGDRHLAEFFNNTWYLRDKQTVKDWLFNLTTVDYRIEDMNQKIAETIEYAEGKKPFPIKKSDEECVDLMMAVLGLKTVVSNVNLPNRGQMMQMPLGAIVETNCVFTNDCVEPVMSRPLPDEVFGMVYRNWVNIETTFQAIKNNDKKLLFEAFMNQPLCASLQINDAKILFEEMF